MRVIGADLNRSHEVSSAVGGCPAITEAAVRWIKHRRGGGMGIDQAALLPSFAWASGIDEHSRNKERHKSMSVLNSRAHQVGASRSARPWGEAQSTVWAVSVRSSCHLGLRGQS